MKTPIQFIGAGAGSGKTTAVVKTIVAALLDGSCTPAGLEGAGFDGFDRPFRELALHGGDLRAIALALRAVARMKVADAFKFGG